MFSGPKYGNPFGSFHDTFASSFFSYKNCENLDDFLSKYSKYLDKIENLESKEGNICIFCENKSNKMCACCLKGLLHIEFIYSCKSGNLDILKFILKCYPNIDISVNNNEAFIHALKNGDLKVLKFLLNLYQRRFKTSPHKGDIFQTVTGNSVKSNIDLSFINESTFIYFCAHGNLKIAKLLLKLNKFIDISAYNNKAFNYACCNGNLEVAKWLFEISQTIDIFENNEEAFIDACRNGHLKIAKWLFEINPTIDISSFNKLFINACRNGHLEIAKWLFEMKPTIDISANDNDAFISACENKHFEVAKWFTSINSLYYVKIENNNIISYRIKQPLSINNEITKKLKDINDNICPICKQEDVTIQTECEHNYCLECITEWVQRVNKNCPYCRKEITNFYKIA